MIAPPTSEVDEGSPYRALAPELREALARSLADRLAGQPGTEANLMFAFPPAPRPPPRTVEEALDNLSPMAVNLLVRLFDRMADIDPTRALWREIRWIGNQWWGGSAGIKVAWYDRARVRARLDELFTGVTDHRMARDTYLGAMEHQARPVRALLRDLALGRARPGSPPPDCDTWREVHRLGDESVHVCVDQRDLPRLDDVHIDWMSPVTGVDPVTRRCTYAIGKGARHWLQAITARGAPLFTFSRIDAEVVRAEARAKALGRHDVSERISGFLNRWRAVEKELAVAGRAGYERSLAHHGELARIVKPLGLGRR